MKRTLHTKKHTKKSLRIIVVVVIAAIGVALLALSQAATPDAKLTVTSSSTSVTNGDTFTIGVYEDSGSQAVNSFSIGLVFETSKVDFDSVDTSGSALATGGCPEALNSSNKVYITCFAKPGTAQSSVTGRQLLANIKFKAKATGTTTFGFVKESAERSAVFLAGTGENIWNSATAGATFTITGVSAPTSPSTGNGGTTGSSTGSSAGGTKTTPAPKPAGTKTTPTSPVAQAITPASGTETTPPVTLQATNGIVAVKVKDAAGKLVAGVSVTLADQTVVTDATGIANFLGVEPGRYTVSASGKQGTATKNITVAAAADSGPIESQNFDLVLQKSTAPIIYIGIAAVVALLGLAVVLTKKWLKARKPAAAQHTGNVVVNGQDVIAPVNTSDDSDTEIEPSLSTTPTAADVRSLKEKMGVSDTDTLEDIEKKVAPQKSHHTAR